MDKVGDRGTHLTVCVCVRVRMCARVCYWAHLKWIDEFRDSALHCTVCMHVYVCACVHVCVYLWTLVCS